MEIKMMLKIKYLIPFFWLLFLVPGSAQQNVNAGVSIGPEGLKSFYLSISNYYSVPEPQVVEIRQRKIPEEELPVVFFIARRAQVKPEVIVDLRLGGYSWYDISVKYGIYPDAYYVPLESPPGPPYGNAYGYYRNKPRNEWREILLSDEDIVNLVNLRFISESNHYKPEKIVEMRKEGNQFVVINHKIKGDNKGNQNHGKGRGQGKGNKKK